MRLWTWGFTHRTSQLAVKYPDHNIRPTLVVKGNKSKEERKCGLGVYVVYIYIYIYILCAYHECRSEGDTESENTLCTHNALSLLQCPLQGFS